MRLGGFLPFSLALFLVPSDGAGIVEVNGSAFLPSVWDPAGVLWFAFFRL